MLHSGVGLRAFGLRGLAPSRRIPAQYLTRGPCGLYSARFVGSRHSTEQEGLISQLRRLDTAGLRQLDADAKTRLIKEIDEKTKELDADLACLRSSRQALSGQQESFKARAKLLVSQYGMPFMVYWTLVWLVTGAGIYGLLTFADLDVLLLLRWIDSMLSTNVAASVDPTLGNFAVAFALNELFEVVRLPVVIATTPFLVQLLRRLRP
jgi:hypothetical protein